tara:strand:+ start:1770 stop:2108 length:339 start_codon:yes stop_codon:yes gene_type:complete
MNKVLLYFIFLCFPARLALALIAKYININYLPFFAIITTIISIGFFINFIKHNPNDKGFFGNKVWWNNYRLIHSFNFALFSLQAFMKYDKAWIILLLDAFIGLFFFIFKYFI